MSGDHNQYQKPDKQFGLTNEQFVNAELFKNQRNALMRYMQVMIERSDWHGVSDVANDLRVLEAENRQFLDYVR